MQPLVKILGKSYEIWANLIGFR